MKIKFFTVVAFLCCCLFSGYGQNYSTGFGLRAGLPYGVTGKHFITEVASLEGILSTRWGGFRFTGLYAYHTPTKQVVNLNWYFGVGAHLALWDERSPWFDKPDNYFVFGIDGIMGMEYTFDEIPLVVGLDWIPFFNLAGHTGIGDFQVGISARYIF